MSAVSDIKDVQAQEKQDIAALVALIPQILAAVANGALSPADAQAILDEAHSQDSDIKSIVSSLTAALPPNA